MKNLSMVIHRCLLFMLFLLLPLFICAQDVAPELSNYAPVSPNAASLGKYGLFPVNYNLGTVNTGVPIHAINTGKQSVDISLSYNTSGIRLNELASWVGLGWTLNSGGAIIRNTKGIPDKLSSPSDIVDLGNPVFNKTYYDYLFGVWSRQIDSRPDEFLINAPGFSGSFFFDSNNNGAVVFSDLRQAQVKVISVSENEPGVVLLSSTAIEVTREDGAVLRFGKGLDDHEAREFSQFPDTDYANGYEYTSTWYLTEMISPNRNDTITFKYKTLATWDYPVATGESIIISGPNAGPIMGSYPSGNLIRKKYLERIEFDNGYVLFDSNNTPPREDLEDEYRLDKISVYSGIFGQPQSTLVQEYTFDYDYFIRQGGVYPDGSDNIPGSTGTFTSPRMTKSRNRALKLNKITIGKNGVGHAYSFDYNTTILPLRGSTSQDFWGYASINSGSLIPPTTGVYNNFGSPVNIDIGNGNRDADEAKMKAASLEKITYPTGGFTIFEYEANKIIEIQNTNTTQSKSMSVTAYGPHCSGPSYSTTNSLTFPKPANYIFNSGEIEINFSAASTQDNVSATYNSFTYSPQNGGAISDPETITIPYNFPGTEMTISARDERGGIVPPPYTPADECPRTTITMRWQETYTGPDIEVEVPIGGLRVKSIKNYDGHSPIPVSIKQFEYDNYNLLQPKQDMAFKKVFLNENSNLSVDVSTDLYFDNNIGSRPAIEYGKVVEFDIDSQNGNTNGKTEYFYETVSSQRLIAGFPEFFKHPSASLTGSFAAMFTAAQNLDDFSFFRSDGWRYGSLARKEVFKGQGTGADPFIKVFMEEHNYFDPLLSSSIKQNYVFRNDNRPSIDYEDWSYFPLDPPNGQYGMSHIFSYFVGERSVGRKALSQTITTNYDTNGANPVTQTTDYFYDNIEHLLPTRTEATDSKGNNAQTKTYYPEDVIGTTSLGEPNLTSVERNVITRLWPLKSTNPLGQNRISEPVQVETTVNGETTVQRTIYKDVGDLVLPEFIKTLKGNYDATDNQMEDRVVFHEYDDKGNPQVVSQESGPTVTYIWGYYQQFPIAKIENASYSDVSSFVANLQNLSNNDHDRTIGPAGSEGALRTALDNLRAALPNAMVSTYTYDPLIGITSMTDPRGYTMYYDYDDFNRLEKVIDADGNPVTDYEYHYKNQ